ncbi:MAG TPA: NAD(P)-binding protein, partial [Solirubrobacteraceae bacterium]|nr:NAD(P)-binding protein [Solirubrobacteraceae bacterium]
MTTSRADLCVVGAGISALNALAVASGYLDRSHRVVLIEKRPGPGGMWRDTYPYVRLHQPHLLFTAGAIAWQGGHSRSYLAARDEVVDHFAQVVDVVRRRVDVEERYG